MFWLYDSERNVIAIGTIENKIPAPIFQSRSENFLSVKPSLITQRSLMMKSLRPTKELLIWTLF